MSVLDMLRIAAGYRTAMADALVAACVDWCERHDHPLPEIARPEPEPHTRLRAHSRDAYEGIDWERMVRGNSEIVGPRGREC